MVTDWNVPGASIGIVKDGKLVFTGNYGVLEVGKKEKPNEHTLYAIASNSKAFTSAIIGMLVQEGKLNWDDKVKKHLPYFALYNPWVSDNVTIADILSHRVGLARYSGDLIWYKSDLTSEDMIRRIKYLPKAFDFRAGYGYSNVMYITAGEIIKKVTGKSWNQNVEERIFTPLQMDRTTTSYENLVGRGNYATPHARIENKNAPITWVDWEEIGAMGGIISSIKDISKWMIFNLNNGINGKDTLLTKETRNMVWTPHNNFTVDHTSKNDLERHFNSYGLGWGLSDYHGKFRVDHGGEFDGMITRITLIPDENLGIVVLTNGMKSPTRAATNYALDKFLGIDSKDWSTEHLKKANDNQKSKDATIADRKVKRMPNTKPALAIEAYAGVYKSEIIGEITVINNNGQLRMEFEHSKELSAKLNHWHNDVWEIFWDNPQTWFGFGTVKFLTDNNMDIKGLEFDVPCNNDFLFEQLKPYRIETIGNTK